MTRWIRSQETVSKTEHVSAYVPDTDVFEFEIPEEQSSDIIGLGHLMEAEEEDELQTRPADDALMLIDPKDPLGPLANWDDDAPIDPWG